MMGSCTQVKQALFQPVRLRISRHQAHLGCSSPYCDVNPREIDGAGSGDVPALSQLLRSLSPCNYEGWVASSKAGGEESVLFVGAGVFKGTWSLETLRSLGLAVSVGNINAPNQPVLDCNVPPKSEPFQRRAYTGKPELHFAFPGTDKHLPALLILSSLTR